MTTIIPVTTVCNQSCKYCSSYGIEIPSEHQIKQQILSEKEEVVLIGGEPSLRKDIIELIKFIRSTGIKRIEFQTNGAMLYYKSFTKKLIESGVTLFNVAVPSHIEKISDEITQTHGFFEKRLTGLKNLMELKANVRITMIINTLNSDTLYDYVKFVYSNFPKVKILELNFIKLIGKVKLNLSLVPKLSNIKEELHKSMSFCKDNKINLLIDGIPLCHMQGYEEYSIDAIKIVANKTHFFEEKEKSRKCSRCTLTKLCRGFRRGYIDIYGTNEFFPQSSSLKDIESKIIEKSRI